MHKKIVATLTIAIFILSTVAILAPVQAHFTLGDLTGTYRYHALDFDPHTVGVIGYVWPGGGQNAYTGVPNLVSNTLSPGYITPWPGVNPPGAPANWQQVQGHAYAPFGAILTSSTGDLIFAINATGNFAATEWGYDAWNILIPPEFGGITPEQIATTVTNDYSGVFVYTLSTEDRFAPGWTLVRILPDGANNGIANTALSTAYLNFTNKGEWYYARINGVTAPNVAGKYFFKIAMGGNITLNGFTSGYNTTHFIPTENWPVLLVKGELDPAIIHGTIRYGGFNSTLYGLPVQEAGLVWATMKSKLDPYTGQNMGDCPATAGCADARGYFNATAMGHYEVEGVAPGVYDVYAQMAGYPQALIQADVQVLKGQSLVLDGYLNPGVVIHGNVYTKHQFGEEPWPYDSYIKMELYDQPTAGHQVASTLKPVSWSPLPCVAGGQDLYLPGRHADECGDPRTAGAIAFPWHEYIAGGLPEVSDSVVDATDPQGVGPLQNWFVTGGTTAPFHFEFGVRAEYGAPRDLDGGVPQVFATWVNGLTAGRYYARAWVFRYVQSALDGGTFQEYWFDVTPQEWAGDVTLPIDLRLSSWVNKTVHFHDRAGTLTENNVTTGATRLDGLLKDDAGVNWSYNTTLMDLGVIGGHSITFYGFNDTWSGENYGIPSGTYTPHVYAAGYLQQTFDKVSVTLSGTPTYISDHVYRGVGLNITVYSIDWERPRVNRNWLYDGQDIDFAIFSEPSHEMVDVICDYCKTEVDTFVDPEQDATTYSVEVNGGGVGTGFGAWFGNAATGGRDANVGGSYGRTGLFSIGKLHSPTFYLPSALDTGTYGVRGWTFGYVQNKDYVVYAQKGQIADIKVNLLIGVNVSIDILFKKENIITATENNMSARVRLFDEAGNLAATWMSSEGVYVTATGRATAADNAAFPWGAELNYLPGGVELLHVNLAGLPQPYYGDPIFTGPHGNFELDNWADGISTHFQNVGILGSPDYTGAWTVEVDFVNWYTNNTAAGPVYYPPVVGLLMGESYHWITGGLPNGFGYTEAGALDSYFLGHSMAPNHLGPYRQRGVWSIFNAHLSGEASGIFEVDLNGYVSGQAYAFTWSTEYRPASWYTVEVVGAPGGSFWSYTSDGIYEFFLPAGSYQMTLAGPGLTSQTFSIAVTDGMSSTPGNGVNFYLEQSQIPIPEFSGIAIVAFSALAASLYLLRRRRK